MRSELEVRRELKIIRARRGMDADEDATNWVTYGAQQSLIWMLGTGMALSDLLNIIDAAVAEKAKEAK